MTTLSPQIFKELEFQYSRSSGPGGQHVNKTETKVTVTFSFARSRSLSDSEKNRMRHYLLEHRPGVLIDNDRAIQLSDSSTRSQDANKERVVVKLKTLLEKSLRPPKKRGRTRIPKASKEKRIQEKKRWSEKKAGRKKFFD